jgi:hypothetical protein
VDVFYGDPAAAAGLGEPIISVEVEGQEASVHRTTFGHLTLCVRCDDEFEFRKPQDRRSLGVLAEPPRFFFGEVKSGRRIEASSDDDHPVDIATARDVWLAHTMSSGRLYFAEMEDATIISKWVIQPLDRRPQLRAILSRGKGLRRVFPVGPKQPSGDD